MIYLIPNIIYAEKYKREYLQTICDTLYLNTNKNDWKCLSLSRLDLIETTISQQIYKTREYWKINIIYDWDNYITYSSIDKNEFKAKYDYSKPEHIILTYKTPTIEDDLEKEIYKIFKYEQFKNSNSHLNMFDIQLDFCLKRKRKTYIT